MSKSCVYRMRKYLHHVSNLGYGRIRCYNLDEVTSISLTAFILRQEVICDMFILYVIRS